MENPSEPAQQNEQSTCYQARYSKGESLAGSTSYPVGCRRSSSSRFVTFRQTFRAFRLRKSAFFLAFPHYAKAVPSSEPFPLSPLIGYPRSPFPPCLIYLLFIYIIIYINKNEIGIERRTGGQGLTIGGEYGIMLSRGNALRFNGLQGFTSDEIIRARPTSNEDIRRHTTGVSPKVDSWSSFIAGK